MKQLHILYLTLWFRCHHQVSRVAPDDPLTPRYPTWREAHELARTCVGWL